MAKLTLYVSTFCKQFIKSKGPSQCRVIETQNVSKHFACGSPFYFIFQVTVSHINFVQVGNSLSAASPRTPTKKSHICFFVKYAHVVKTAVTFVEVQTIADYKLVGNFETNILHVYVDFAACRLTEQRRNLHACRTA